MAQLPHPMLAKWQPRQFLTYLAEIDSQAFASGFGGTHFLLVNIEEAPDRLLSGLFQSSPLVRHETPLLEPLAGVTEMGAGSPGRVERSSPRSSSRRVAEAVREDATKRARFLAPLKARAGGKRDVSMGRNLANDVILKHPSISRVHATWREGDEGMTLTDLESKNGTWVNGERLWGSRALRNGDRIRLGQIDMLLCEAEVIWKIVHPDLSTLTSSVRE